ncbi:hypothetical protein ACK389_15555 [Streptomyces antibioticus]|uniref:CBM-cenC domain-containing protein n=1 Tax=Streptomyces antibioticus TaxID=1890 RepID=A0AAE7CN52_STRAT|nr:hypothetical protein [Streptomyces antibioticus]MCX5172323.1 hypothetical protein [Streptomyces antibioticus]OOQ47068.1 hypothetical protein AFM16_30265 [Streptomyces antibioticus]QIT47375.1 hypothetical protein HCX60_30800 [Streptomyces antibioticus]
MGNNLWKFATAATALGVAGFLLVDAPSAEAASNVIRNGGFEDGSSGWTSAWSSIGAAPYHSAINNTLPFRPHIGAWKAELGGDGLGGEGFNGQQSVSQTVTLEPKTRYIFSYWLYVTPRTAGFRELEVTASAGGHTYRLDYRTNKDVNSGYQKVNVQLPQDLVFTTEQRVRFSFTAVEDAVNGSPFLLDDVSLSPVANSR